MVQNSVWDPFFEKLSAAKKHKQQGEYDIAMKLEMSMAADELGLQLVRFAI